MLAKANNPKGKAVGSDANRHKSKSVPSRPADCNLEIPGQSEPLGTLFAWLHMKIHIYGFPGDPIIREAHF